MANFFRLMVVVASLVLGASSALADGASFPAVPGEPDTSTCNAQIYPDPTPGVAWSCGVQPNGNNMCGWLYPAGHTNYVCTLPAAPLVCPSGSTMSTVGGVQVCSCGAGLLPTGGQCLPPVVDHAAEAKAVADALNLAKSPLCFSGAPALQTCFAGYVVKGGFAGTAAPDSNGPRSCIFPNFTADGTTCNPVPDAVASPSTCQGGKVPGTVNGIDVCVDPGKTVAPGSTSSSGSETTNPDSTKTPGDAAQSSGQTSCTGTSCTTTTTTTTTKPDGSITVTTHDKTEPKDSFCESNPASPLCAKSSFSASCGGPASCTGDAIQCAIAQEQHRRGCRLFDDVSPESQLYEAGKGKEGNQTGSLPGNEIIGIAGRINTSDALGGGSAGVADLHVTVWGQSIMLPFSTLNPYLAALGNVLLAVSFLLALRIVARG